jgi:hypothetical protein
MAWKMEKVQFTRAEITLRPSFWQNKKSAARMPAALRVAYAMR